jgi:hypothetical protein
MAGQAEFEIDENGELNFLTRLGTDKSASIIFQYKNTAPNIATIFDFDVEVEGKDISNSVLGIGSGGGATATKTDAGSIASFGLQEEIQNFSESYNATDLDNETQSYLDSKKVEFYAPRITVNPQKIDTNNIDLGDTVQVILDNGFISINMQERIVKISVRISESGLEVVDYELVPVGTNRLPSSFSSSILDLQKRVALLEGQL